MASMTKHLPAASHCIKEGHAAFVTSLHRLRMAFVKLALFIALVARTSADSVSVVVSEPVYLIPGQAPFEFESANYPAPNGNFRELIFSTIEGHVVRVVCSDFRTVKLSDGTCHDDKVTIAYGDYRQDFCGLHSDLTFVSKLNRMKFTSTPGKNGAAIFKCKAQATQPSKPTTQGALMGATGLAVPSEEVDSSEHGGPPGEKRTTCDCGWTNKVQTKIVKGKEAGVRKYPFMAQLVMGSKHWCGGSIITSRHVLTAAHCTQNYTRTPSYFTVHVGKHLMNTVGDKHIYQVVAIYEHEQFDSYWMLHDISIMMVNRAIEFSTTIGRVCLSPDRLNIDRQYVKAMGWGNLWTKGNDPNSLQEANIRVVPIRICRDELPRHVSDTNPTQICTFSKTKSICNGDSGGPLVYNDPQTNRYVQVGISSYVVTGCADDKPAVFTDVSAHYDWIQKIIRESSLQETCHKIN